MSRMKQSHRNRKVMSGCQGLERQRMGKVTANRYRVSCWGDENVLELGVMGAQSCDYIVSYRTCKFELNW